MIDIKLRVPKDEEECQNSDCKDCDLDILTCSDCGEIWELGLDKMNNIESKEIKDFSLVTTGPVRIDRIGCLYHLVFVPKLFRDGNMWCALYGENIMEGIVGFGKTPDEAIYSFNNAFYEEIVDNEVRIE